MNWDMITAIVVVFGAIFVAAALIYIAHQQKAASRQRSLETILREVDEVCKLMAHDQANSDIWWRASKGVGHLTDAERVRYFAMLFIFFRSWEKVFRYQNVGELEQWSAEAITKPMLDFTMNDGVQEYWALRRRWYAPDFQEWVDKQIKGRSGVDVYGEQFRMFGSADPKEEETG